MHPIQPFIQIIKQSVLMELIPDIQLNSKGAVYNLAG